MLLDDHGRLFGRVNLIDAAAGLLILFMVPVGYGAYALFRVPPPTITAIDPATVSEGTPRVRVRGADFRPYLRATLGSARATFLLASPSEGVLELPVLAPGVYDVALFDVSQEVARQGGALTIVPRAIPPLSPLRPPPLIPQVHPLDLSVRVISRPDLLAALMPSTPVVPALPRRPVVLAVEAVEVLASEGSRAQRQEGPLAIAVVRVRSYAIASPAGWRQWGDDQSLKIGASYTVNTYDVMVRGEIMDLRRVLGGRRAVRQ